MQKNSEKPRKNYDRKRKNIQFFWNDLMKHTRITLRCCFVMIGCRFFENLCFCTERDHIKNERCIFQSQNLFFSGVLKKNLDQICRNALYGSSNETHGNTFNKKLGAKVSF